MSVYRLQQSELRVISIDEREELLEQLGREINSHTEIKSSYRNKMKKFLAEMGIRHIAEIDITVRMEYQKYLGQEVLENSIRKYMKAFDQIKRRSVQEQVESLKGKRDALAALKHQIIFLPYHPEQEIAKQFERFVKTDNLIWDFRQKISPMLKKQIFSVLHYMLLQHMKTDIRSSNLAALKKLYEFCIEEQISNIEYLEQRQAEKFINTIKQNEEPKYAIRILDQCRRILFIEADEIHWDANIWYLERFHFEKSRVNPTNPIRTFSFIEVEDKKNRKYLQQYMKYCLGITYLTIGVIRRELSQIRNFMVWVEKNDPQDVRNITERTMEQYFRCLDKLNIQEDAFNQIVISVMHFFDYLKVQRIIEKIPFCEKYYLKKEISKHHDRSVEDEICIEIVEKLKYFPEELRLMFLHLWSVGLRGSEVCALKGNAYYIQGRDAWIQVYQIKMRNYKRVPIPWGLYKLMQIYLQKYQIKSDDYIFQNKKGGACCYGTFRKRMLKCCMENKINNGEYLFKSHDYRHSVATMYYENDVSIQSVRDYLGHKYEEMTKQYVDYMTKRISRANEKYFEQENNSLASGIKRCKRGK